MRTIREIQFEKAKDLYRRLLTFRNEKPDMLTLERLLREIVLSTQRTPMSGKYRLPSNDTVDTNSLNVELGLIKADAETIYTFLDEMQKRLRTLRYVADVWKQNARNKVNSAMLTLAKLTSPVYIQGFTEELNTSEIVSQADTDLVIDEDGAICLPMITNESKPYKHLPSDISISRIGTNLTATVLGTPTNIVNRAERGSVVMNLSGNIITEAGFKIEIKTDTQDVNLIYLQLADVKAGIKVKVEVSSNLTDFTTVYDTVTTRERIDIPIEEMDIKKIIVSLTMDAPNIVLTDNVQYEFKVEKILMMNDRRHMSGTFQSSAISVEDDITSISLVTDETTVGNCTISYYMTSEVDTNGDPIAFTYMDTKEEGSFLSLRSGTSKTYINTPDDSLLWKLSIIKTFGSRLYNLLEIMTEGEETEDYTIENGAVTITDGNLIQDSIKLYRGVGDYVKLEKDIVLERHVDWVAVLPDLYDEIEWVKRVPLRFVANELIEVIGNANGSYYNQFTVPYTVLNYEEFRIVRSDGKQVNSLITDISFGTSTTTITLAAATGATILDPAYKYHAMYAVSLKEYSEANDMTITLDTDSFEITAAGLPLSYEVDYYIDEDELEIELLKSGVYQGQYGADYSDIDNPVNLSEHINMKYTFTAVIEAETSYYETYVYVNSPTEITILPFTASEIAAGNFHSINGEYISASQSYVLKKGWNQIETTQPFPSLNEYDTNEITSAESSAGIVIPEDLEMRAYMDSMRQVPPHRLATMDIEEGSKCFAYSDGRILVNFVPSFLDEDFLATETTSDMKGEKFLNKKASYGTSYENLGWVSLPEKFGLEFGYTESGDNQVFIRATIECDEPGDFGKILMLGLNKYKEI